MKNLFKIFSVITLPILLFLFSNSSRSQDAYNEVPDYLTRENSCAVFFNGLPLPDDEATSPRLKALQFWSRINSILSYALFEKMKDNYRVYLFENLHSDANRASELVAIQLAALKCNRVLQIGFLIDEDSAGPYFLFSVDLNKAVFVNRNSTGHTIRLESEFQKSYRYVRTGSSIVEFMDAPTDNFTNRVLTDLADSSMKCNFE